MRSVRLGDFRHHADKDGEVIYTLLLPRNTKKDTGGMYVISFKTFLIFSVSAKVMTKNSKSYKGPVSVRRTNLDPEDLKFDLVYVLNHLRFHLAKLGQPEEINDLPLFWKIRSYHIPPHDCFYLPKVRILSLNLPLISIQLYSRSWASIATGSCCVMQWCPLALTLETG